MKSKTESGRKSVFSKTVLNNYEQSLTLAYGKEKASPIFDRATSILNNELNNMDDRGKKVVRKHLSAFILPGFASYKALKESGDHVSYDPLSPKIVFKRSCTLAQPGKKVCDFCFEKGV